MDVVSVTGRKGQRACKNFGTQTGCVKVAKRLFVGGRGLIAEWRALCVV
ncbi:MAG: hypothetical protein FWD76_03870 [Firmicutes bacterium]|nr:hypothetical protein [Bacillota bacterium]